MARTFAGDEYRWRRSGGILWDSFLGPRVESWRCRQRDEMRSVGTRGRAEERRDERRQWREWTTWTHEYGTWRWSWV